MKHPAKVHTKQQQTHLDIKHRYSWPLDMCKGTYKSIYTQTLCMRLERKVFPLHRGTRMWNDERTSMKPQKKTNFIRLLYEDVIWQKLSRKFCTFLFFASLSPHIQASPAPSHLNWQEVEHTFPLCWESGRYFLCVREEVLKSKTKKLAYVCYLWEGARWVIAENF